MNISHVKILQDYHSSFHYANEKLEQQKLATIECLAFAPLNFFKELASDLKIKLADILRLFKDSKIIKFFNKIGWSFRKLFDILKQGWDNIKILSQFVREFVIENKITRWTTEHLEKLDELLKTHPKTRNLIGFGLAGILIFIWLTMSFSGDPVYDFDVSDIFDAMSGNYSFSNIFGGTNGIKLLSLFATGAILKTGFPWPGPREIQFISAVLFSIAKRLNQKLSKELL